MAKIEQVKMNRSERQQRYFSEGFRKQKVKEIELGQSSVTEISKAYQVSRSAIYKWVDKYSTILGSKEQVIVEKKSDTKKIRQLQERIAELEQMVGQKQIALEFYEQMIQLAEEHYGVDLKKNFGSKRSSGTGSTVKNTRIK